jgi:transmembrane sensor
MDRRENSIAEADRHLEQLLRDGARVVGGALEISERDVVAASGRLQAALSTSTPQTPAVAPTFAVRSSMPRGGRVWQRSRARHHVVAAGIAMLAILVVFGMTQRPTLPSNAPHIYTSGAEQSESVRLTDGSTVLLAPRAQLRVASDFGRDSRTVELRGDAYFTVPSAARVPFIVRTRNLTSRVLGTAFLIRSDSTGQATRVVVTSGRVAVATGVTPIVLSAGMQSDIADSSAMSIQRGIDTVVATAWARGELAFVETRASSVLAELGRWYGYDFKLIDRARGAQMVTVTFDLSQKQEVFVALQRLLDVSIAIDGRVITLIPNERAPRKCAPNVDSRRLTPQTEVGR